MKDIKIIVATHAQNKMPGDEMYLPVQVGALGKQDLGYQKDCEGDNISHKNPSFCELTGLYWAWKNLDAAYVGLAHYRRHFKGRSKGSDPLDLVLTWQEADRLLEDTDILVTKKRRYYIENIYDHYAHTLYVETLDKAIEVIHAKYPQYSATLERCMKHTHMHAFNMMVMKKDKLDAYCRWLFDILFEVEQALADKQYSPFHARYPGRISELLLDVWLEQNGYSYKEVPFLYTQKVDYVAKVTGFLKSKFLREKYEGSF